MRAHEFIKEVNLNIPDQMVSVQIPLSAITGGETTDSDTVIVNPGKRVSTNGDYKWSPPLQQHLDTTKDAVGPSNDEITADDALAVHDASQNPQDDLQSDEVSQEDDMMELVSAILSRTPALLR
jgi:hypothetical protein